MICYASDMRYLGIDFGTKKVGLALSDETGSMAFPHAVVPNDVSLLSTVERLLEERDVAAVVIGHSVNKDASPNEVQKHIEAFMTDLTLACGVPIHLEPEQYTTQAALRIQGRNRKTDASAAALILDGFLSRGDVSSATTSDSQ